MTMLAKLLRNIAALAIGMGMALGAAAQSTYTLRGIVIDSLSRDPLSGATVLDSASFHGAACNLDGRFTLAQLPAGTIRLTITCLGYASRTITVRVPQDLEGFLSIPLLPISSELKNVVVVSSFEGQQRALNQQRSADNIKNIISADLIGKFPDLNVAEALQRVPGININRDKGEGSTVSIRGTPAHFTSISINGEQLPSVQQNGARNEALDLIPADQLASMEITKALTADMDGDAVGGNINLRTPTARKPDLQVRAEAGLGFNDLSGGINGVGRLRVSKRYLTSKAYPQGKLGVMLSGSYFATDNSEDRIDSRWNGRNSPVEQKGIDTIMMLDYQLRKTENRRTRMGATATFDYKVKNHEIVLNYMYNYRRDDDIRNRLRYDFDRSGSRWIDFDSVVEGRVRRDINLFDEVKSNHNFNLQGFHTLGKWQVDWGASYTLSQRSLSSTRGDFARDVITIVADNPEGIFTDVPQFRPSGPGVQPNNPLLLNDFRRYEEDAETTDATNLVGRLNVLRPYTLKGYKGSFKMGGKVRMQTNAKFRDNRVLAFFDPNNTLDRSEAFARVMADTEPIQYLNGKYRFGPRVDAGRFTDYMNTHRRLLTTADDAWDSERLSRSDTYEAFEDIYAGYAMNRIQIKKWMVLTGLRYEFNSVRYDAFDVFRSGTSVQATPVSGLNEYGYLLPSVHVKYSPDNLTNFRFAYTHSYARPNFVDIVPFVNYDADAITLQIGNTELAPSLSKNIDLMYERYYGNGGILSFGVFYKNMDRFQFTRIVPSLEEDFPGFPQTAGFRFRQEQNGERAIVYGAEVNLMRKLDFLPGIWQGLSIYMNYTFTQSDAFTQDRVDINLPGQAMHTGNASLSFDYKGFTSKVSLNYNGSFINSVASSAIDDIIQDERLQLDLNLNQRITKKVNMYAEFINLTNSPTRRFQGSRDKIAQLAYFGWWGRVGVTFNL